MLAFLKLASLFDNLVPIHNFLEILELTDLAAICIRPSLKSFLDFLSLSQERVILLAASKVDNL